MRWVLIMLAQVAYSSLPDGAVGTCLASCLHGLDSR